MQTFYFSSYKEAHFAFICNIIQPNQTPECCAPSEIYVCQLRDIIIIIKLNGSSFILQTVSVAPVLERSTKYIVI